MALAATVCETAKASPRTAWESRLAEATESSTTMAQTASGSSHTGAPGASVCS